MIEKQLWAMFVLRLMVGIVFLVHGAQKIFTMGLAGVTGFLQSTGIPLPEAAAVILMAVEFIGGILLILGLFTRWASIPLAIVMLVAIFTVHLPNGFGVSDGGAEFALTLLAALLALALSPNSKLSLDSRFFGLNV